LSWTDTKPESPEIEQTRLYVQDADYVSNTNSESPSIITLTEAIVDLEYASGVSIRP
jgi:hypothetical protein